MKTLMPAPTINANVYAKGSADRFDGLGCDDGFMVQVEYHIGDFEPPEPAFWIIDKVFAARVIRLLGTEIGTGTLTLQIPAGFDITDLFTRSQLYDMETDLTRMLLRGDDF